jgi:8-oxo-dGTP diphosphatase
MTSGLVVGAAIIQHGRVLAALRPRTSRLYGWELPGGKVEPGETLEDALVREIREELGCTVEVGRFLDARVPVAKGWELVAAPARITAGEPVPHEHEAIRWLGADDLAAVDWLPADRPLLASVEELLR